MKNTKIVYYIFTGLLSAVMLAGAFGELSFSQVAVDQFVHLGYPLYMLYILGTAKFLGVIALWQNKFPNLREWAYAGFFIDLVGAIASHLFVGDDISQYGFAVGVLVVTIISYINFKKL
ncbi:MAG: DoxX family protein [Candidatus Paceibacterota bacterium]